MFSEHQRTRRLVNIFKNMQASARHRGFRRWYYYMVIMRSQQELNEHGPETEPVFEAQRICHNLLDFMRHEGYTEEEIRDTFLKVD